MDVLASVEPHLAIPVVGVLCALLVYIFGFQKTQEPTFQHLAALTTKSKAPSTRQRSTTPQVKSTPRATKEKSTANGHAVQEKSSPKPNGTVKSAKKDVSNKENVRPQKAQSKKEKEAPIAEDLESGDWIQAVSRKDKKNKLEKTKQESSQGAKSAPAQSNAVVEEIPAQVLKDIIAKTSIHAEQVKVDTAPKEEPVAAPVTPKQTKDSKKKSGKASAETAAEASPKKEKSSVTKEPAVASKEDTAVTSEVKVEEPVKKQSAPASPVKEAPKPKVEESQAADPRSNIAFDEMGDAWEEAKSRGTKKRRARKD